MDQTIATAVRGVITLSQVLSDYGTTLRFMNVQKIRGSRYQGGEHPFSIRTGGIELFPRAESQAVRTAETPETLTSGIEALDRLFGGGVERGTATIIAGQTGVGKTTIALQFLVHAALQGERSQVFSMDESAESMLHRAEALGIPAAQAVAAGWLGIERVRSTDLYPAEFALKVRQAVDHGARMLLIDSLTSYAAGVTGRAHFIYHLSQLREYLAQYRVTLFLTLVQESDAVLAVHDPFGVSHLSDNLMLLRLFEAEGQVYRAMSILKKRRSAHETTIRAYEFTSRGIEIGEPMRQFQGVLTGVPHYTGTRDEVR